LPWSAFGETGHAVDEKFSSGSIIAKSHQSCEAFIFSDNQLMFDCYVLLRRALFQM
jgi:hypothetical protein